MAFKLENIWYAVIIMSVISGLMTTFLGFMLVNYGVSGDTSKLGALSNNIVASYTTSADMQSKFQNGPVSSTDATNQMIQGGYTSIRSNPYTMATYVLNTTTTIAQDSGLGIDKIFSAALTAMLFAAIGWGLVYLVMRFVVLR